MKVVVECGTVLYDGHPTLYKIERNHHPGKQQAGDHEDSNIMLVFKSILTN